MDHQVIAYFSSTLPRVPSRRKGAETMHYLHHVHAASACAQTVYLSNFLPSGPCLCRVLHTSLSFIALPNGTTSTSSTAPLSEIFSAPINARILRVVAIPSTREGDLDKIAVLTDHHQPRLIILRFRKQQQLQSKIGSNGSTASFSDWTPIETEAVLLLDEMGRPAAESGLNLEIEKGQDPAYMISHTHAGILKVVPLSQSTSRKSGRRDAADTSREISFTGAFGVRYVSKKSFDRELLLTIGVVCRLPHPHLISSTFLEKTTPSAPSTLALLSLSSVASRIPGLGMQCLPVLSFHSIDEDDQELKPVGWGPPRRSLSHLTSPASPKLSRRKSSVGQSVINEAQDMPGAFRPSSQTTASQSSSGNRQASSSGGKSNGPAALGANKTADEDKLREEALVKSPLTRAHIPIPFVDALGVHLLLSLPARVGGGVVLFGETCVFHIASPYSTSSSETRSPSAVKSASSAPGKRRKASIGQQASQARQMSGSSSAISINELTSPTSSSALPAARSNENGKRRRSTVGSQGGTFSTSPTSTRKMSASGSSPSSTRILRLEHSNPIIVASAIVMTDPSNTADDGVDVNETNQSLATLKILYGTHSGLLHLLILSLERSDNDPSQIYRPTDMFSQLAGSIPAPGGPNAITYLGENFISIASTGGDSVVIQLDSSNDVNEGGDVIMAKPSTHFLKTVFRWSNLAPILDFVVDDGAGGDPSNAKSAQARIITASGTGPTGSLRIVRNGVSLEDVISIDETNVRRLWSIPDGSDIETRLIVLGYHASTRLLKVAPLSGGFEDVSETYSAAGLHVDRAVLEAAKMYDHLFVLVNDSEVGVWSIDQANRIAQWTLTQLNVTANQGTRISKAAIHRSGEVLLSSGSHVVFLQIEPNGQVDVVRTLDMQSEVSALDINSLSGSKQADYAAISLWNPQIVKLVQLSNWEDVTPSSLAIPQPNLIRSMKLHTFSINDVATSEPHLLLGLGDGTLNSYGLSLPTNDSFSRKVGIIERRSASMGSQPLHLRSFTTSKGLRAIFVSCDRPSVVFSHGKGLQYSTVRHREVHDVCQFTLKDETMMIFAKMDQLIISKMGQIQKLDVGTVELGNDNPVALAMSAQIKAIAVASNSFFPLGRNRPAVEGGKIMLFDNEAIEKIDEYQLEQEERANCIEAVTLNGRNVFVAGTGFTFLDRSETLNGRVLVFGMEETSRKLRLLASHNVDGNTYAVGSIGNRVIACVNSKVLSFDVDDGIADASRSQSPRKGVRNGNSSRSLDLMQVGEWACAFTAVTLRTMGDCKMVIGDALRSLVLLKLDEDSGRVIELARDCDPYWTIAAEILDEEKDLYIGSDIAFNIWTCSRLKWTEEAKKQIAQSKNRNQEAGMASTSDGVPEDPTYSAIMKRQGAYHYGDLINTMKRGSLISKSSGNDGVASKVIFATAAGAIGIIAELQGRTSTIISQLEMSLRESVEPIGGISAEDWRTLRTDHRMQKSAGFVDGDFVNSTYEHLSADRKAQFLNQGPLRIEAEAGEMNSLIESLNRLS